MLLGERRSWLSPTVNDSGSRKGAPHGTIPCSDCRHRRRRLPVPLSAGTNRALTPNGQRPQPRLGGVAPFEWMDRTSRRTSPTPLLRPTRGGVMLYAPIPHRLVDDAEPPPRQCGRCQLMFAGDPTLYFPPGRPGWWLCPRCRAILLGRHPHSNGVAHRRRPPRRTGDTS
jgi:hypothetical protein